MAGLVGVAGVRGVWSTSCCHRTASLRGLGGYVGICCILTGLDGRLVGGRASVVPLPRAFSKVVVVSRGLNGGTPLPNIPLAFVFSIVSLGLSCGIPPNVPLISMPVLKPFSECARSNLPGLRLR